MMQKERTDEGEQKVDLTSPSTTTRLSESNALGPLSNLSQSVESQRLSLEYGMLPPVGGGAFLMNSFFQEPSAYLMDNTAALMRRQQDEQHFHATRLLLLQQHQDQALRNRIGAATNNLFAGGLGGAMGGGFGGALGGALSTGFEGGLGGIHGGGVTAGQYFSGNTAASRASLDHFSVMLQQHQDRNQLLRAGYRPQINLNMNMPINTNAGMSLLQHRQLQEESWNAELKVAAASSSPQRSSSKSVNAQLDANAAYYDASKMPDPEYEEGEDDDDNDAQRRPNGGIVEPFPSKLYRMIEEAEKDGHEDIVSFFPHGRAFAIHKPRVFISQLMPKYFSTSRMSSFQRQLNLYGFRRITEGRDKAGYFHEFFLKGRKGLCKKVQRKKLPKVATIPVNRGAMMLPVDDLMHDNMGSQNTLLPLSDAASLYQLQMLAAAQSGGYGVSGIGGGFGGGPGNRVAGNFGENEMFSSMLGNTAGLGSARSASIGLSNNAALLQDQKQLLDQLLLQQQIQLLQQTPNFAAPRPRPPRGNDGEMPPSA